MTYLITILICYVLGAINPAYIIGHVFHNVDIRQLNSKNAGTSNVWMTFGKRKGASVAIFDILKGLIPVVVLRILFIDDQLLWVLGGMSSVVGHVFPFYMKFKGGKGTATFGGVVIGLLPILAIPLVIGFFLVLFISDFIALSTLFLVVVVPFLMYVREYDLKSIAIIGLFSLLSIFKHMENYKRIMKKEEKGFRGTLPSKSK